MERKYTGVRFTPSNSNGANWGLLIFSNYRLHLLDTLKNYGESDDFGYWLNDMQSRHANLYKNARNSGDWLKTAYANDDVRKYQEDYQGIGRHGQFNPDSSYKTDFNNLAIVKAQENDRYNVSGPRRISGDYGNKGFKADGLYSAITDDRRLLGRKGDWDENSDEFKQWLKDLNSSGWETYLDKDDYYKLRRVQSTPQTTTQPTVTQPVLQKQSTSIPAVNTEHKKFNLGNLSKYVPGLLEIGRLIGNQINNEKVYDEAIKGIKPDILDTYHTYRQVVGDEAGKQAYYKRAAEGEMRAAKPITSDMDKLIAYRMEAKKNADDLRALGDLVDNQEIRRTSDEANQHLWANALRDVEVNNTNKASRNKAEAMRHNLLAQKHSAQWTSFDNFLQGIGSKVNQKLAEERNLDDLIFALQSQKQLAEDPRVLAARKEIDDLLKKHNNDYNHPEVLKASLKYKTLQYDLAIELAQKRKDYYNSRGTIFGKSGTKITRKEKKDELLYKSTRDAIEHFRKMSKLSSDSLNRKPITILKLTSHQKGNTRRYLYGGVAPFTIYRPIMAGGETTTTTQNDTSNTNGKSKSSDMLDMVKKMFEAVQNTGLPIDVNVVYKDLSNLFLRSKLFGDELSTDDIASIYLQSMLKISNLKYSKENYDKAMALATSNESLNEFAVDASGNYVVLDKNGNLSLVKSLSEIVEKGLNPITNQLLLNLRAYSPDLSFLRGDAFVSNIINNGMGINKIGAQIKALAGNLGSSEGKLEGISLVESGKVKAGLLLLAATNGTPDGYYSVTKYTKDLLNQILVALKYIENMLSPSLKAILKAHGGVQLNIMLFLSSQENYTNEQTISPLTGKAAKDANGNNKEDSEGLKLDAATALVTGKGYKAEIELNPGSSYAVNVQARFSGFLKPSGENMGAGTTMLEASESTIKGNLDWNKATIGGSKIIPTAYNQIVLNNGEVAGMDLPIDPNNPDTPNLEMLKQLENLDKQLKLNNIEDNELNWKLVNDLCDKLNIPKKYDSSGKLNKVSWKRFAAFLVTTPDTALVDKNVILDMIGIANDHERELYNRFIQQKTNDKNFELSDTFLGILGHRDELYKGTVFVPIKENIVAAAISSGQNIYMSLATDLEMREQGYNPDKVKSYKKSEYRL